MTKLRDVLAAADPLRHEPGPTEDQRARLRHTIISAASSAAEPSRVGRRMPIALLAAFASIVVVLMIASSSMWPFGNSTAHAAVRFEVRLAEEQPAAGLTAAGDSNRTVYLHPEVVVTNADIAFSSVIPGNTTAEQFWIDVRLNAAGAAKMRQATMNHLGRPVAILIDGEVVMAPTVKSPIGAAAVISGDFTRAEAERIAQGMNPNQ
jgi:SecDF, P1 head subdomain